MDILPDELTVIHVEKVETVSFGLFLQVGYVHNCDVYSRVSRKTPISADKQVCLPRNAIESKKTICIRQEVTEKHLSVIIVSLDLLKKTS